MLPRFLSGHKCLIVTLAGPIDTEKKLGLEGSPVTDPTLYCSLAEALQYLNAMKSVLQPNLNAMKCVLRYLRGTTDLELQLFRSTTSQLIAYSVADWAGCPAMRRSTSKYYVFLSDSLRTWSSKRQDTLSRSSAEAKYRGFAIYMSANPVQHKRTKHIEIDIHFVRDKVATGYVRVLHVPSRFQYADIFTKGLPYPLFTDFRSSLSLWNASQLEMVQYGKMYGDGGPTWVVIQPLQLGGTTEVPPAVVLNTAKANNVGATSETSSNIAFDACDATTADSGVM
nr:ribonuclease H-like domain-containing protein [Tanacetum cinerariifolium]